MNAGINLEIMKIFCFYGFILPTIIELGKSKYSTADCWIFVMSIGWKTLATPTQQLDSELQSTQIRFQL
jgi:hypothetical protein